LNFKKKEKLYIQDLIQEPLVSYPSYYLLSYSMAKNEMLHDCLIALHSLDFAHYHTPKDYKEIFKSFSYGSFAIYKTKYAVAHFGGKLMYLEANGWKSMPITEDAFDMQNWLVC